MELTSIASSSGLHRFNCPVFFAKPDTPEGDAGSFFIKQGSFIDFTVVSGFLECLIVIAVLVLIGIAMKAVRSW
jgi:hypothetical protein